MDFKNYPRCVNGDVLIVLAHDKVFQLHAEMLRRHSKFFRAHLADGGASLCPSAKRGGEVVRWRFDLVDRPGHGEEGAGTLGRVDLDSMARPLPHSRLAYNDLTQQSSSAPALFGHYDKVFGAMYGQTFDLDRRNATIEELLEDVVGIIDVSEYLGCIHAVAHTINAALLGQGQVLWRSVQANPFAWVDLALRVRSTAVATEAMIHLVGRWNALSAEQKAGLDQKVRNVCEWQFQELQLRLTHVECRVLKFYPAELTRPVGAPPTNIQRMSYANDIYTWMALCLFRHWFAAVLAVDQHRHAPDGGYWLYSRLAKGGDAYLDKDEVNKFHEKFPMSTRGEHVLDRTVNKVKAMVRPLVAELVRSEANLDQDRFPVEYLTCAVVKKEEVQALLGGDDDTAPGWGHDDDSADAGVRRVEGMAQRQAQKQKRQVRIDSDSCEVGQGRMKRAKRRDADADEIYGKTSSEDSGTDASTNCGSASESDGDVSRG